MYTLQIYTEFEELEFIVDAYSIDTQSAGLFEVIGYEKVGDKRDGLCTCTCVVPIDILVSFVAILHDDVETNVSVNDLTGTVVHE